jgi:hypothetical protein
MERVTGIEPALSAWEYDRSERLTGLTWASDVPLVTVTDSVTPGLMARQWPGDLAYCPSLVSSSRSFTFVKMASCATRGIRSQTAVAATHRSASCSFWPRPCPVRTHQARSEAYVCVMFGPGHTISARAISRSRRRSRSGPQPTSLAPYSSSATVRKEMIAGRPSRTGR